MKNLTPPLEINPKNTPSALAVHIFEIANRASKILLHYRHQLLKVDYKIDEFDPITIADREADAFIRNELHKSFPRDAILSEENNTLPDTATGRV